MALIGEIDETEKIVLRTLTEILSMIHARTLVISWAGSEKKWYGTHVSKPDGQWDNTAEDMMSTLPRADSYRCIRKRRIEKERERNEIHSFQRWR